MECTESSAMEGILNLLDTFYAVMNMYFFVYLSTLLQQSAQVDHGRIGTGDVGRHHQ